MSSQSPSPSSLSTSMPPHTPFPSLTVIVATTPSLGIGYYGSLPWPALKPDLAFFARVTKGTPPPLQSWKNGKNRSSPGQHTPRASINALVMGRKTWVSIPVSRRPLGDRVNVVITRHPSELKAELKRTGLGKGVGADGKQHVIVAGSIEEGLWRLVQEYPPLPTPPSHKRVDGDGAGGGNGGSIKAVTEGNQEERHGSSGQEQRSSLGRVFVIGGAQIYGAALELDNCVRVVRTRLDSEWKCDLWFPSGVFVDHNEGAEDTNENMGGEGMGKMGGWVRRPDEELDAWCGESVGGEKTMKLENGEGELNWRVEMWGRKRASVGDVES